VRRTRPARRYPLKADAGAGESLAAGHPIHLTIPRSVPPRTYDLELRCDDRRWLEPHCVAVGKFGRALRVVHLSNMNVGSIGAPAFDQRLVKEVNLVAPDLIVATGDYLDATHPDPSAGWQQLVDYVTRFDAPLVMASGDHDRLELYSRHVTPSPIGLVDVGPHRCLLLLDHALAPIRSDSQQLRWAEHALPRTGLDGMTFVVTHDDAPNLLRYWQQQGTLSHTLRAARIGVWFSGGNCDWDGRVRRDLIDAVAPMLYIRTHQSSPATCGGATGVSHYRVIDVAGDHVILPNGMPHVPDAPPSTPVGCLQTTFSGANDGSQTQLAFQVVNNLPHRLDRLALWLRLRKIDGHRPWCHGARLDQITDLGYLWECRVRFGLPDKGALEALAGSGPEPPRVILDVRFEVGRRLRFRSEVTSTGLTFQTLTSPAPLVQVRNVGNRPVEISPLVRFDGDAIAYRLLNANATFATAYRLRLRPGESSGLELDLSAVRVTPGRRELQVYLRGPAAMVPSCHAVNVVNDG
jgi:hypothetical protein